MAIRKDGIESSEKLLKAAIEVFAEKGYKNTTVAEICRRAGSNIAAVNYHFGSKDELYATVWKNAFAEAMKIYPPDGGVPDNASAEQKLRALVYSNLHRILDEGRLGCSGQILLREMAEHTDIIMKILHDTIRPLRQRTENIISELLGPNAEKQQITFCELSLVHQCFALGFRKGRKKLPADLQDEQLTPELIDALAEHITIFSLAGIKAVREKIESK